MNPINETAQKAVNIVTDILSLTPDISKDHNEGTVTASWRNFMSRWGGRVLLLGLGLTEFSVNPSALLKIKNIITSVDRSYAQMVAAKVMQLSTADEIISCLKAAMPEDLQDHL